MNAYSQAAMPMECCTMAVEPMDAMALSMGPMTMGPMPQDLCSMGTCSMDGRSTDAMSDRWMSENPLAIDRGQERLPWSDEIWRRIDRSVDAESRRTRPASAFLPRIDPIQGALTIDSDTTLINTPELSINEAATLPLVEIWVELVLTPQQVEREMQLMTACALARRATNVLTQATDLLIFQGDAAVTGNPLFVDRRVRMRSGPAGPGLLNVVADDSQTLRVSAVDAPEHRFAGRTFEAVTEGCARLEGQGHYGPYALILHTIPSADIFAPLAVTLTTPASLLEPMLAAGLYETGTLPSLTGLLISVGGNSMDLVVGCDATTTFLQQDVEGKYVFRVYKRFALRVKDRSAIVRLSFGND